MTTEYEHDCTCEDPMYPGMKLLKCGSKLCRAIKDKMPLVFNGHAFLLGEEDDKYYRIDKQEDKE